MTNSTDMFKLTANYGDNGSVIVDYSGVQYFLVKGSWYYLANNILVEVFDQELQEILDFTLRFRKT